MIIDEYAYLICEFGMSRTLMHITLTMAETVIFKILYMYKYSVIVLMDEYFLTNFLTLFNVMINFGLAIIRVWLNEHRRTKIYFLNFAMMFMKKYLGRKYNFKSSIHTSDWNFD